MEVTKAKLETHLLNKSISKIEIFNFKKNYFEVKPDHSWIFNGGFTIHFGEDCFGMAWDHQNDGYDYFINKNISELLGDIPYESVGAENIDGIANLNGQTITEIDFVWEFYQDFDENGELKEDRIYVPMGLKMRTSNGNMFQISIIETTIKAKTLELHEPVYNLFGEMLVSVDNDIAVEEQRDSEEMEEL